MERLLLAAIMLAACAQTAQARSECDKLACDAVKEKIRTIEARMRSGYTRAQGEKYETQLRKLKAKRYRVCR
jgi:hypothetical protein